MRTHALYINTLYGKWQNLIPELSDEVVKKDLKFFILRKAINLRIKIINEFYL